MDGQVGEQMAALAVAKNSRSVLHLFDRLVAIVQLWSDVYSPSRSTSIGPVPFYRVSIPKPIIAVTSTGSSPRNAGRNFHFGNAARIFEVVSAAPGSSTLRSFSTPVRSRTQANTTCVGRRPSGRSLRRGSGSLNASREGCVAEDGSEDCITAVPSEVSI